MSEETGEEFGEEKPTVASFLASVPLARLGELVNMKLNARKEACGGLDIDRKDISAEMLRRLMEGETDLARGKMAEETLRHMVEEKEKEAETSERERLALEKKLEEKLTPMFSVNTGGIRSVFIDKFKVVEVEKVFEALRVSAQCNAPTKASEHMTDEVYQSLRTVFKRSSISVDPDVFLAEKGVAEFKAQTLKAMLGCGMMSESDKKDNVSSMVQAIERLDIMGTLGGGEAVFAVQAEANKAKKIYFDLSEQKQRWRLLQRG